MGKKPKLRWKMGPKETGLSAVCAGPRGHVYHDGNIQYATVHYTKYGKTGWYWVAGWGSDIPNKNTCKTPCKTVEEAKKEAEAYVKSHLSGGHDL